MHEDVKALAQNVSLSEQSKRLMNQYLVNQHLECCSKGLNKLIEAKTGSLVSCAELSVELMLAKRHLTKVKKEATHKTSLENLQAQIKQIDELFETVTLEANFSDLLKSLGNILTNVEQLFCLAAQVKLTNLIEISNQKSTYIKIGEIKKHPKQQRKIDK